MRRFKRKARVFYLNTPSFGAATALSISPLSGIGNSAISTQDLLLNDGQQSQDVIGNNAWSRMGPTVESDNIIDGINGQVHWTFCGDPSGGTPFVGQAMVIVRSMIYTVDFMPNASNTSNQQLVGSGNLQTDAFNISVTDSLWSNFTRGMGGTRILWQKTWSFAGNFGVANPGQITTWNSSQCDPPSTWIACKPRKRLRQNARLFMGMSYSVLSIGLSAPTGNSHLTWAPSLRVAAHRVRYRRS